MLKIKLCYVLEAYDSICSGITSGRVLSGELYAQRLQKSNADKLTSVIFLLEAY